MTTTNDALDPKAPPPEANDREKRLALFQDVTKALELFPSAQFHQLVPTVYQQRSTLFRPAVAVVSVNADDQRDVYPVPGGGAGLCLHSTTLERIGNAIGIDWDRTDIQWDPREPYVCTAYVRGDYIDNVGQRRRISASATEDLRDGSVAAGIAQPKQLQVSRQFIQERAESRARNRAIRKVANLRSSYTKAELAKPFACVRWQLDDSDPEVRQARIAAAVGASDMIFGGRGAKALPEGDPIEAGHEGPEAVVAERDVVEGDFREQAEPPVVEPEEPKPQTAAQEQPKEQPQAEDPAAARKARALAVRKNVDRIRETLQGQNGREWSRSAREKPASEAQIGLVAGVIAKAVDPEKRLSDEQKKNIRRAVLAFLWKPFQSYSEIRNDQASATIEWAKALPDEVRDVIVYLVAIDPQLESVSEFFGGQPRLIA